MVFAVITFSVVSEYEDGGSMFLRNVNNRVRDFSLSLPKITKSQQVPSSEAKSKSVTRDIYRLYRNSRGGGIPCAQEPPYHAPNRSLF
jgi:hypothetical protein